MTNGLCNFRREPEKNIGFPSPSIFSISRSSFEAQKKNELKLLLKKMLFHLKKDMSKV